ncbi:hypothetical protein AGMMS50212_01190 [Spirochaetia bacterium]|nr:hypothetical protein AGMMS50212_01190 [Spirochaetia bacterium]
MLLTFPGFFEKGQFVPEEPVKIAGKKKAVLSILDAEETEEERIARQLKSLEEMRELLDDSVEEELPEFKRANLHREADI